MTEPTAQTSRTKKCQTSQTSAPKSAQSSAQKSTQRSAQTCNEVTLVGRVSAVPETRDLPSGDQLVTLRVVVDRPPQKGAARRSVDVIDVACWTKRTQRTATGLEPDDGVRVEGALRRRFFAAGAGRASRYEVEASRLVRVSRQPET